MCQFSSVPHVPIEQRKALLIGEHVFSLNVAQKSILCVCELFPIFPIITLQWIVLIVLHPNVTSVHVYILLSSGYICVP